MFNDPNSVLSLQSSPPSSSCSTPPSRHVTRVTASAKVKVEVHTAVPGKFYLSMSSNYVI